MNVENHRPSTEESNALSSMTVDYFTRSVQRLELFADTHLSMREPKRIRQAAEAHRKELHPRQYAAIDAWLSRCGV